MGQDKTLTRGARAAGAAALSALALIALGWIVRDFVAADAVVDVWWAWSGMPPRASDGLWATSFADPLLLVLYTVCAVTAVRSSSAAGILAAAGALTVLLRLPSLWNLNSDWMTVVDGGTKQWALVSVVACLVLGGALLLTAAVGRRPIAAGGAAVYYAWEDDTPPAPPTRGGAVTAALLLGGVSAALAAWEAHTVADQGWALYRRAITGDDVLVALLSVPGSWYAWLAVLAGLAAAFAALGRAPSARPLGMTASALFIGVGVFYLSYALKTGLVQRLGEHSAQEQLRIVLAVFEVLGGLAALCALAPRGEAPEDDGRTLGLARDYGPGTGPGYSPPPPANPPPNW